MGQLFRKLRRYRSRPGSTPPPLHIDFHPIGFPTFGRTDTVHRRRTLNAPGVRLVQKHEWLSALRDLFDLLAQQPPILDDRLVRLTEMLAGTVLDRPHRLDRPLVMDVNVG